MKKSFLAMIFLVLISFVHARQTMSTKDELLRRSKHQKTAGFVLLGAGVLLFAIAAPGEVSFGEAAILAVGGGAAVLGSIPLFLASGRNKRMAMRMTTSFRLQQFPLLPSGNWSITRIPTLAVWLSF
jgi:hypothetical protein